MLPKRRVLILFAILAFCCWSITANQDESLKKARELREALRIAKAMKPVKSNKSINKPKFTPEIADQIAELTKDLTGWSSEKFQVPPPAADEEPTHETPTERAKRLRRQATYANLLKEVNLPEDIRQNEMFQEVLKKVTNDHALKNKIDADANRLKERSNLKYVPKYVLEKEAEQEHQRLQMQFLEAIETEMQHMVDGKDEDEEPIPLCRNPDEEDSSIKLASGVKLKKKKDSQDTFQTFVPVTAPTANSAEIIHNVLRSVQMAQIVFLSASRTEKIIIGSLLVTSMFVIMGIIYRMLNLYALRAFSSFTMQGIFGSLFIFSLATARDPFQMIAETGYLFHDILMATFALSFAWFVFLSFLCLFRIGLSNLTQFVGCTWVGYHFFDTPLMPVTSYFGMYTGVMFLMSVLSLIQLVDRMLESQPNKSIRETPEDVPEEPSMIHKKEEEQTEEREESSEDSNDNNSNLKRRKKQK